MKYSRKGFRRSKDVRRIGGLPSMKLVKGRRCGRIEDKGLCPNEKGVVSQNAKRNSVKICGSQRGPKKAKGSA